MCWLLLEVKQNPGDITPWERGEGSSGVFVLKDARCVRTAATRCGGAKVSSHRQQSQEPGDEQCCHEHHGQQGHGDTAAG